MQIRSTMTFAPLRRLAIAVLATGASMTGVHAQEPVLTRTPATPLVAHDPYFSIWSLSDALNDQPTRHWTGSEQQVSG